MSVVPKGPLLIGLACFCQSVSAVDCTPDDISLGVQADVDNFQAEHGPGCDTVVGELEITLPLGSPPISSLDGLSGLVAINGGLRIRFQEVLENIDGLANVTTIHGGIELFNNTALLNLDGLSSLGSFSGGLSVTTHPVLQSIAGLSGITGSVESLYLSNNDVLASAAALSGIDQVSGTMWIYRSALQDLDDFSNLTEVGLDFYVAENDALVNMDSLQSLEYVGGDLLIEGNDLITDLDGLAALSTVGGDLTINNNREIQSIAGIANLVNFDGLFTLADADDLVAVDLPGPFTTLSGLRLLNNDLLADLFGLFTVTTIHGDFEILGNSSLTTLAGLSSLQQIDGTLRVNGSGLAAIDFPPELETIGGLRILNNFTLSDFSGLSNLQSVSGEVFLSNNGLLPSLSQLSGISEIGGVLRVEHSAFHDLALTSLVEIGGGLELRFNSSMTSLDGLESLARVAGGIHIDSNPALLNIDALAGVTEVAETLEMQCGLFPYTSSLVGCAGIRVISNNVLHTLGGLQGIPGIKGHVVIEDNPALSQCGAVATLIDDVDDFVPGPGPGATGLIPDVRGLVSMSGNHSSCGDLPMVTSVLPEFCLPEGMQIYQQSAVDNFQANHQSQPGTTCTKIIGSLRFRHPSFFTPDITNFDGVSDLTTVGASFEMYNMLDLTSMGSGLSQLIVVGGNVLLHRNTNLPNLDGFTNLSHIGGGLTIEINPNLTSLSGLTDLTFLGSDLRVAENPALHNCNSLVRLIDSTDHAAPGPGAPPVPDVGGEITFLNNLQSCNSVESILDANIVLTSGFESPN